MEKVSGYGIHSEVVEVREEVEIRREDTRENNIKLFRV